MSSVQFKGDAIPDKLERQFKQATKALSGIPKESAVQLSTSDKLSVRTRRCPMGMPCRCRPLISSSLRC